MSKLRNKFVRLCDIPKDLDSVITIDRKAEVSPRSVGMKKADVDAIWDKVIAIYKTGNHPAITVNIRRRGKTILSRAIGHARGNGPDDSAETPKVLATPETPICLFSTSKAISALMMHMLAEDGLINVMDPVTFYAPEFAKKGKENITIHQILSHRGGVPGLPRDMPLDVMWDPDATWDLICESEPITTDGSKLAYHAVTGGFVLEQVMRTVTGGNFNDYIDRKIRKPMGMKYFSYGIEDKYLDDMSTTATTGPVTGPVLRMFLKSVIGFDLSTLGDVLNDPRMHKVIIPSANLIANAVEVTNFFQMMLDGGVWKNKRICRESTVARCVQEYGNWTIDKTLMAPMRYSAGMMLGGEPFGIWGPHSHHAYGHAGLINKFCWADPERELAATILNTGLPLISNHIPPLVGFLRTVGNLTPRTGKVKPFSLDIDKAA